MRIFESLNIYKTQDDEDELVIDHHASSSRPRQNRHNTVYSSCSDP